MYSLLILVFLFFFTTIHPKCFSKSHYSWGCDIVIFERSSDIASFVEHPVFSSLKMYRALILLFLFCFATFYPKNFSKSHFFLKSYVLRQRSSDIASIVEHPVHSNLKTYSCPNSSFIYFVLPRLTQSKCVKVIFSWNFRCSAKGDLILLLLRSTPYVAISECILFWFYLFFILICNYLLKVNL